MRQLQAVGAGPQQIPVYKKLVALAVDKHQSPDDAIGYLHEILQLAPDEPDANARLLELLEKTERFNDLIDVLDRAGQPARAGGRHGGRDRAAGARRRRLGGEAQEPRSVDGDPGAHPRARSVERARAHVAGAHLRGGARPRQGARHPAEGDRAGRRRRPSAPSCTSASARSRPTPAAKRRASRTGCAPSTTIRRHLGALAALEKLARARGDWGRVADLLALRLEQTPEARAQAALRRAGRGVRRRSSSSRSAALPYLEALVKAVARRPRGRRAAGRSVLRGRPLRRGAAALSRPGRQAGQGRQVARPGAAEPAHRRHRREEGRRQAGAWSTTTPPSRSIRSTRRRWWRSAGSTWRPREWEKARRIYRSMLLQNLDPAAGVTQGRRLPRARRDPREAGRGAQGARHVRARPRARRPARRAQGGDRPRQAVVPQSRKS